MEKEKTSLTIPLIIITALTGLTAILSGSCAKPATDILHDYKTQVGQTVKYRRYHEPICLKQGKCSKIKENKRPWFYIAETEILPGEECNTEKTTRPVVGCKLGFSLYPLKETTIAHNLQTGDIEIMGNGYPAQRVKGVYINTKKRFEEFRKRSYSRKGQKIMHLEDGKKIFVDTVDIGGESYIPIEVKSEACKTNTRLIPFEGAQAYECPENKLAELREGETVACKKGEIIIGNYELGAYAGVKSTQGIKPIQQQISEGLIPCEKSTLENEITAGESFPNIYQIWRRGGHCIEKDLKTYEDKFRNQFNKDKRWCGPQKNQMCRGNKYSTGRK